jgi:hypothetical protein
MERSDERLSTRDIASPSSGADTAETDTAPERDARVADTPPADTAAVPDDRADRDFGGGGAVAADRVEPVGDGDVVTEAPAEGRGTSRESVADPEAGVTGGDTGTRDTGAAGDSAGAGTAAAVAGTSDVATRADPGADSRDTQRDSATNGDAAPLLSDAGGFQTRWEEIQVRFVDEPRGAVEDADALVATVMQRLAEGFAQERERLEAQWGRGEDISTEDLRVALQRYRSFFQRLLST